jgi:hypothetical protein
MASAEPQLSLQILHNLTLMLQAINPFIQYYKTAREQLRDAARQNDNIRIHLKSTNAFSC